MAHDIVIPKLGFSMSEGKLVEWLAQDGAQVKEGDPLYTLESEKSTTEIEAPASGTLRIGEQAGDDEFPVGHVIGKIE
jgi:pyruvate/2-oxoglutarate dehydrogenase complex dihydrolipoamide acyltransferase (E2) component